MGGKEIGQQNKINCGAPNQHGENHTLKIMCSKIVVKSNVKVKTRRIAFVNSSESWQISRGYSIFFPLVDYNKTCADKT